MPDEDLPISDAELDESDGALPLTEIQVEDIYDREEEIDG
jgi:hypothetical protein